MKRLVMTMWCALALAAPALAQDALSGRVTFGDLGAGTFTGKRQAREP